MLRPQFTASRSLLARFGLPAALLALGLWSAGCGGNGDATNTAETPEAGAGADHDHDHGDHDHAQMSGDVEAALAELSPEDRTVAEAQQVCAVAGEPLGSMGPPIKVEYEGKPVFLCCSGCRKAFEADPEKYIATLPNWADESGTTPEEPGTGTQPTDEADTPPGDSTES
jgi:YHS domain-containing protein